jgi:hypothetical protein
MQLTDKTTQVLKNFASINPNIVINPGNVVRTISEAMNALATAEIDMTFPQQVGIYDLNEFLSVVSLVDSPDLVFNDDHMIISDGSGRSNIKYHYSSIDILTTPKKEIIMPEVDVSFNLDRDTLNKIKRAAAVFGHTEMSVYVSTNGVLRLSVIDISDVTSNTFSIDVDGTYKSKDFKFIFNISNLKMIDGSYVVGISSKLISHFVNKDIPVQYWVSLEKSSTYGV